MIITHKPGESSFEQLDEGMYPAVCVGIIGVGTQRTPFVNDDGTPKIQNKAIFTWETKGGNWISKEYTVSLHEKSNLRKDLESWRGKKFKDDELEAGFDIKNVLGKPCNVQVMLNKNDYATVTAVLPKTEELEPTRELTYYSVAEHDEGTFEKLPDWIKTKITNSFEWQAEHTSGYERAKETARAINAKDKDVVIEDIGDEPINLDDIPF